MQAFVYRWRELNSNKWYIGYHRGSPDDGYICSSSVVRPLIEANPQNWTRKILRSGTTEEMYMLEVRLLKKLNASKNSNSYNRHNGQGHAAGGRKAGAKDRYVFGMYINPSLRNEVETIKPKLKMKKPKNPNDKRGGARPGAGRKKGSKDFAGLHNLIKGLEKLGVKVEGITKEEARLLKIGLKDFKFVVVRVDNSEQEPIKQKDTVIDELFT